MPTDYLEKILKPSDKEIDEAGKQLILESSEEKVRKIYKIISKRRSFYVFPLQKLQNLVRAKVKKLGFIEKSYISQRQKRISSIKQKLSRISKLSLSQFQDIGGVRIVLPEIADVIKLRDDLLKYHTRPSTQFELLRKNDYIIVPKPSGYRSIHFVYKYIDKKNPRFDGLLMELQMRTRLQHVRATTVETFGTIFNVSLKSNMGDAKWLEYFKILSAFFANIEGFPPHKDFENVSQEKLQTLLKEQTKSLKIKQALEKYATSTKILGEKFSLSQTQEERKYEHFVVTLDAQKKKVEVMKFEKKDITKANAYCAKQEEAYHLDTSSWVVLISLEDIKMLKKTYPNLYADTRDFLSILRKYNITD